MLPVLAIGATIVRFRHTDISAFFAGRQGGFNNLWCILGSLFFCFTALLGVGFTVTGDYLEGYSEHSAFQGVIIRGLEFGWPPPNLLLPEVAWSYNYAAHLWILGVKLTTDLPIDVLVARYGPLFLGGASAAMVVAFGRYVVGLAWWIAFLPVVCVYWVIGIPSISGGLLANFMPFAGNLILSPFLGIMVFLLTLAFVLGEPDATRSYPVFRTVTLALLVFLATGARGVCPPILLCALALRLLVATWRKEGSWRKNTIDLVAAIVGFAAGLRFFFTVGTEFSGTGALKFTGQPFSFLAGDQTVLTLAHTLMRWGIPSLLAGIAAFVVIAVFQAAFLTPALPAWFAEFRRRPRNADLLLAGCAIAGTAGFFLTEAPGLSHVSFLYFSELSMSLLAARGLQRMIPAMRRKIRRSRCLEAVAIALTVLLCCLHLSQLPMKTVAWIGERWSASAFSLVELSSLPLPRVAQCMRDQDADLFASAGRVSQAAVVIVIPIPAAGHCETFWWVANFPLQTLSDYLLTFVPGRASDPVLQNKILTDQQHMWHAMGSAAQGILDAPDLVAIAKTIDDRRPVFVMAPRGLSVGTDAALQRVGADDRFALWQVSGNSGDQTVSRPSH